MGIGQQDTIHIPPRQEMQGVYGSAVVSSGGQHTEPVEAVDELPDGLAVAVHVFRQFHIGNCDFSHLQGDFYTLDAATVFVRTAWVISLCRHLCLWTENLYSKIKSHCSSERMVQ